MNRHRSHTAPPLVGALESRTLFSSADNAFGVAYLAADRAGAAENLDANLVDPRGLSVDSFGNVWVANAGSRRVTSYTDQGVPQIAVDQTFSVSRAQGGKLAAPQVVLVAPPDPDQTNFPVAANGRAGDASLVVTATGTVQGFSTAVSRTSSILAIDGTGQSAVYSGAAIATIGGGSNLFVTDVFGGGMSEYSAQFGLILNIGRFSDPDLPDGYSPYNVTALGGDLLVTYIHTANGQPLVGANDGFVDEFDSGGNFIQRIGQNQNLNDPWSIAKAPADFGRFSNDLLIANQGSGLISAFNSHGQFRGYLEHPQGSVIRIPGLAGIGFGAGSDAGSLYFTADESTGQNGILGKITLVAG